MSGKPGRSGRKPFEATADQRNTVKIMSGLGVPQEKICLLVINRQTRKPISEPTLRRAFRREIDSGQTELTTLVGNMLVEAALGLPPAVGEPIKSDAARLDAAIFYLECQAGWRRGQLVENVAKEGGPSPHQVDVKLRLKDHLRRIREVSRRSSRRCRLRKPTRSYRATRRRRTRSCAPIERFWARKKAAAAAWIVADVAVDGGPRLQTK